MRAVSWILGLWQIYNGKSITIWWLWYPHIFKLGTKHVNIVEAGREKNGPQNLMREVDLIMCQSKYNISHIMW